MSAATPPPGFAGSPPAGWAAERSVGAWLPAAPQPWRLVVRPRPRALLAVAAVGVAFDLAVRAGGVGLAAAAVGLLAVVGLPLSGVLDNARVRPLLVAAAAFSAFLAVRAHPVLLAVDALAALACLALAAALARTGEPANLSLPALAVRACLSAVHALLGPHVLGHLLTRRSWRTAPILRGLALALPLLAVVGGLAAAGDAVFAGWLGGVPGPAEALTHLLLLGSGAWGMSWLLHAAAGAPLAKEPTAKRWLGHIEASTVLLGLVTVLGVLAVARVAAAAGGAAFVERAAGLTYAQYARSGFFQLLWAAAVTLAALMAVRAAVVDDRQHAVVRLAVTVAGLALVVVGTAVWRLLLYVDAFGLTLLRLSTILAAVWIGLLFACVALAFLGVGRERHWVVPAALASGAVLLLAFNAVNPEALIVRANDERADFDLRYAVRLSDDAVPALLTALPELPATDAIAVKIFLCAEPRPPAGPAAWNAARHRADAALAQLCR